MERGRQRGRRGDMDHDIYNPHTPRTEMKTVEAVNGKGMYVVRSKPPLPDPYCALNLTKSPMPKLKSKNKTDLFSGRELKRKKRVARYKWYAIEGSVKASLKNGFSWFKRKCSRLVHGV